MFYISSISMTINYSIIELNIIIITRMECENGSTINWEDEDDGWRVVGS